MEDKLRTDTRDVNICQHLYLRGNFKQDMFYDKVDMINVWNRLWLSAEATKTQILSAVVMNNHLHLSCCFKDIKHRSNFKHHFRLSATQYHNRRYDVHGTLGTRTLKHASLKDEDDIKDCICYHIRNVLHHGISSNYLDYAYSTARCVFDLFNEKQQGFYTHENLPDKLDRAYLPVRVHLPKGWKMTREGMIIPPAGVFRADVVENLFNNSREKYLEVLTQRTTRETEDSDSDGIGTNASHSRIVPSKDEQVVEFIKTTFQIPIPAMNNEQKMAAIYRVIEQYPKISKRLLARIFGIPKSTLERRLQRWDKRESLA